MSNLSSLITCPFPSCLGFIQSESSKKESTQLRTHLNASHAGQQFPLSVHSPQPLSEFYWCNACQKYFNSSHKSNQNCPKLKKHHTVTAAAISAPSQSTSTRENPSKPSISIPPNPQIPLDFSRVTFKKVCRHFPRPVQNEIFTILFPLLTRISIAITAQDHALVAKLVDHLFDLPQKILSHSRGGGSSIHGKSRFIKNMLRNFDAYRSTNPLDSFKPSEPQPADEFQSCNLESKSSAEPVSMDSAINLVNSAKAAVHSFAKPSVPCLSPKSVAVDNDSSMPGLLSEPECSSDDEDSVKLSKSISNSSINANSVGNLPLYNSVDLAKPYSGHNMLFPRIPPPLSSSVEIQLQSAINQATHQFRSGYISKAVKSLYSQPPLQTSEKLVEALELLNPPPHKDAKDFPELPPDSPLLLDINLIDLIASAKKLNNGSSSGPTGWSIPHCLFILQNPTLAPLFCTLLAYIARGQLIGMAKTRLLSSRLIALLKKSDPFFDYKTCPPPSLIRPIAVGEVFYRLIAHYLLSKCVPLSTLFPNTQLGFHPSGCQTVIHKLLAILELGGEDSMLICADFNAAFQTRDRSTIATAFYSTNALSQCFRLFHMTYSEPTNLIVYNQDGTVFKTIQSRNGVQQGGIFSSIAFALSVQSLFQHSICSPSHGLAIIDDFSLAGPAQSTMDSYDTLLRNAAADSFPLNKTKCQLFWPHKHDPPQQVVKWAASHGLKILRDYVQLLGSAISLDSEKLSHFVQDKLRKTEPLLTKFKSDHMRSQMAVALTSACATPKFSYLSQTLPADVMFNATDQLDSLSAECLTSRLHLPQGTLRSDSLALQQVALPLRLGGLNSCRSKYDLAPLAFTSLCRAIPFISELLPKNSDPQVAIPKFFKRFDFLYKCLIKPAHDQFPITNENKTSIHNLPDDVPIFELSLPSDSLTLWRSLARKPAFLSAKTFYKVVATPLATLRYEHLKFKSSLTHRSRLLSFFGSHHYLFLRAHAENPETSFSDLDFANIIQFRLGLNNFKLPKVMLSCPLCQRQICDNYYAHAFTCPATRRKGTTKRHDAFLHTLAHHTRSSGANFSIEARPFFGEHKNRKPDGCIHFATDILSDVCIQTADAPSNRHLHPHSVLLASDRAKSTKYLQASRERGKLFIPSCAASHGALSPGCLTVVDQIAKIHAQMQIKSYTQAKQDLHLALSCALQRGNSEIINQYADSLRKLNEPSSTASHAEYLKNHSDALFIGDLELGSPPDNNNLDGMADGNDPDDHDLTISALKEFSAIRPNPVAQPLISTPVSSLPFSSAAASLSSHSPAEAPQIAALNDIYFVDSYSRDLHKVYSRLTLAYHQLALNLATDKSPALARPAPSHLALRRQLDDSQDLERSDPSIGSLKSTRSATIGPGSSPTSLPSSLNSSSSSSSYCSAFFRPHTSSHVNNRHSRKNQSRSNHSQDHISFFDLHLPDDGFLIPAALCVTDPSEEETATSSSPNPTLG